MKAEQDRIQVQEVKERAEAEAAVRETNTDEAGTGDNGNGGNAGAGEEGTSGAGESNIPQTEVNAPLSNEIDEFGKPFVHAEDGTTTFGEIREESGLQAAPIKLSQGFQGEDGKGYGLEHIEANHGRQIRDAGFASVEKFVSYVAKNYDEDNIRVGKHRVNGSTSYLIQVTDEHDNTLFIELSKDGSYWNVNSGGVFRKGYSNKKETVVKTEPQQPTNAVSDGSSLSEGETSGNSSSEPNGEPTVSARKDTNISETEQENIASDEGTAPYAGRSSQLPGEEYETEGENGTVYHRPVLIDGRYRAEQIDEPDSQLAPDCIREKRKARLRQQ